MPKIALACHPQTAPSTPPTNFMLEFRTCRRLPHPVPVLAQGLVSFQTLFRILFRLTHAVMTLPPD